MKDGRRFVIKVGSSLVTSQGAGLDARAIACWAAQIAKLRHEGREIVLVSSGAIAEGMQRLGWKVRPHSMHELQAAAAVGQMGLVQVYETCFREHGLRTAQVLLTHADLADRQRYLNARSTLLTLLGLGVIPIINENDTVVTDEIRFGDNDTLGALVTNLVEADYLVILTDQSGLFTADPRLDPMATLVAEARAGDPKLEEMAGGAGSAVARGGMLTKVAAARRASRSGAHTIIASGRDDDLLLRLSRGEKIGTLLSAGTTPLAARKQWLADQVQVGAGMGLPPVLAGLLILLLLWSDGPLGSFGILFTPQAMVLAQSLLAIPIAAGVTAGAVRALRAGGKSLLPIGVRSVEGEFERGAVVACIGPEGEEVARGLVNYGALEARRIAGHPSSEIESILGYVDEEEMIHRDNLVLP